jgi:hypothetical protein
MYLGASCTTCFSTSHMRQKTQGHIYGIEPAPTGRQILPRWRRTLGFDRMSF